MKAGNMERVIYWAIGLLLLGYVSLGCWFGYLLYIKPLPALFARFRRRLVYKLNITSWSLLERHEYMTYMAWGVVIMLVLLLGVL